MSRILTRSRLVTATSRRRWFEYADDPSAGYSFECDQDGTPIGAPAEAMASYEACLRGEIDGMKIVDRGIRTITSTYRVPATMRCDCGATLELVPTPFDYVECGCGRGYNSSGQALLPPHMWEEPLYEDSY